MAQQNMKNEMDMQSPDDRIHNFDEVALGYTDEQAALEAGRCLLCKNHPCVSGCPVGVMVPGFISKVREKKYEEAYEIISQSSMLGAVCGRVCTQEKQCENQCIRGIKGEPVSIGRLERFVSDKHFEKLVSEGKKTNAKPVTQHKAGKIAVVGSGPSGLACAYGLINLGYEVTVFEALHKIGGVLVYGIPEFRLPKRVVSVCTDELEAKGVKFETDVVIGKTMTIDELKNEMGYDAVFVGTGAGLPKFMGIPGENFNGVLSANEFLTRVNLMTAYKADSATPIRVGKRVAVVGGGNVAMDAARCARRLGAEVTIVYRRTEVELPARREEIARATEEGIKFSFLSNPSEITADEDGWVTGILIDVMELGQPDASGRRKPVSSGKPLQKIECDTVIMALGTSPNPLIVSTTEGLETGPKGDICVSDETGKTSCDGVFAGGDVVTGSATVISAMRAGKLAAIAIDEYISSKGNC